MGKFASQLYILLPPQSHDHDSEKKEDSRRMTHSSRTFFRLCGQCGAMLGCV